MLSRRSLITGLISFVAAPAIVRASSLMPVKVIDSFDPEEVMVRLTKYFAPDDPVLGMSRLFWIGSNNKIVQMSIKNSGVYLDSLND